MAAANSQARGLIGVGKRFINRIRTETYPDPTKPLSLTIRLLFFLEKNIFNINLDVTLYL